MHDEDKRDDLSQLDSVILLVVRVFVQQGREIVTGEQIRGAVAVGAVLDRVDYDGTSIPVTVREVVNQAGRSIAVALTGAPAAQISTGCLMVTPETLGLVNACTCRLLRVTEDDTHWPYAYDRPAFVPAPIHATVTLPRGLLGVPQVRVLGTQVTCTLSLADGTLPDWTRSRGMPRSICVWCSLNRCFLMLAPASPSVKIGSATRYGCARWQMGM